MERISAERRMEWKGVCEDVFICCNKNLLIREGSETLRLSKGFIGGIDDRWANHWYIKAAIADGSIVTNEENQQAKREPKARKTAAE